MLYLIAAWNCLLISCSLIGTALLNVFKANSFARIGDRFIVGVWLGLVIISISLLAISLIFPLSPLLGTLIIVSISLLSLLSQCTRTEIVAAWSQLSPNLIWGFLILEVSIAALMSQQVRWDESGAYHFGSIHWISKFGAVPGLALLYRPLGIVSSWFALTAPFNPDSLDFRLGAIANGFIFLITILHLLICLVRSVQKKAQFSDWFAISFSFIFLILTVTLATMSLILISPSPDLPIILLTEVVAWAILIVANYNSVSLHQVNASISNNKIIPLILAAGAVTIKLSALPLLFIAGIFYIFSRELTKLRILLSGAITVLLLSPMFIFGVVTSGCPLYPSNYLCLNLPWSQTTKTIQRFAEETHGWKDWFGAPPPGSNSVLWLLWQWFSSAQLNQLMAFLVGISIICAIYVLGTLRNPKLSGQVWLLALGVVGVTFIMLKGPLIRLGLGYLILLPSLSIAIFCKTKLDNILPTIFNKITSYYTFNYLRRLPFLVCLFLLTLIIAIFFSNNNQYRLVLPPKPPTPKLVKKQVNDITYFSPQSSSCWAAELPCVGLIRENIKLRDPARGIEAGFVNKK